MDASDEPGTATPVETPGSEQTKEPSEMPAVKGRAGSVFSRSRDLARVAHRDPEHVSERMTLYVTNRLAGPSRAWADTVARSEPDTPRAQIAEQQRIQAAKVARVDGAIAGTPFLLALVPGYLAYLQQEARMTLRIAALYGRDPGSLRTAAELLTLRGVHSEVEVAEAALIAVRDGPAPVKPDERRPLRTWWRAVRALLVFGGFMSAPEVGEERNSTRVEKLQAALAVTVAAVVWLLTWVLPVTLMVAMAWGCESHARQLGRRTIAFYDGEAESAEDAVEIADRKEDAGHSLREIARIVAIFLSVAVPIAFVAYADHVRHTTGINWLGALGALVALSMVGALTVITSRR